MNLNLSVKLHCTNMFSAAVKQSGHRTEIRLAGTIDHTSTEELARALEHLAPAVCLDLHAVERITSYGVGLLIRHLSVLSRNHKLEFARCSETMVDQFQMLKFSAYGRITSFQARYLCSRCQRTDSILLEVGKLAIDTKTGEVRAPTFTCRCGGYSEVDDSLEFVVEHLA